MRRTVELSDAERDLDALVDAAAAGEEILLTRAGTPMARIMPLESTTPRVKGVWRGRGRLGDDVDAPLPDALLDAFEGRGDGPLAARPGPDGRSNPRRR
ncbi:MAG: type II toxin-antitoxin system prevent-host-death family antitoxin [Myxococcota bacterium]